MADLQEVEQRDNASEDAMFWLRAMRQLLRNAIDMLVQSDVSPTLENVTKLIPHAPQGMAEEEIERWQADKGDHHNGFTNN